MRKISLKVTTFDRFFSILTDKTSEAIRLLLHNGKGAQLLEKNRYFGVIISENVMSKSKHTYCTTKQNEGSILVVQCAVFRGLNNQRTQKLAMVKDLS